MMRFFPRARRIGYKTLIASLMVELDAARAGFAAMEDTADKLKEQLDEARLQLRKDALKFFAREHELEEKLDDAAGIHQTYVDATNQNIFKLEQRLKQELNWKDEIAETARISRLENDRLKDELVGMRKTNDSLTNQLEDARWNVSEFRAGNRGLVTYEAAAVHDMVAGTPLGAGPDERVEMRASIPGVPSIRRRKGSVGE